MNSAVIASLNSAGSSHGLINLSESWIETERIRSGVYFFLASHFPCI
jgi:hypothetical protein